VVLHIQEEYQEPLVQHSSVTSQKTGIIDLQKALFSKIFRVGKYHSLHTVLSSRLLCSNKKIKVYKTVILIMKKASYGMFNILIWKERIKRIERTA
jgi:hypothetical protein